MVSERSERKQGQPRRRGDHRRLRERLPKHRGLRIAIGFALVIGGVLGFLPIVGFWMIPLGLAVLAIDFAPARRASRRLLVWLEKRRRGGEENRRRAAREEQRRASKAAKEERP